MLRDETLCDVVRITGAAIDVHPGGRNQLSGGRGIDRSSSQVRIPRRRGRLIAPLARAAGRSPF
ncbi:hypothetical protein GCM10010211_55370 [Streptomyces albospinus]|uniref:Uncharacterized protein n=1 Tax=Streptomyces albospinus TaxID=285515 RepID=A0ABQ2VHP7_9ACTN|nr:hypothetical protein GCM10010211_55370 [Streptomyces albospinus]